MNTTSLSGLSVLVVEDDFSMALDLQLLLEEAGASVIGPVARIDDALDIIWDIMDIDVAVLDVNLQGQQVFRVAEALRKRGIPFVFATGDASNTLPEAYRLVPICDKPLERELMSATVLHELGHYPFGRLH